ncbi:MAG: outer membrane protein assembly factor BamB [Rhodocyclaceae bacterium]|nr:outer membrane protein assembly factor BamB [Rhodocyclaceae bacterium]
MRRRIALALAAVLSAAGCSTLDSLNPFSSSGPKLAELPPITSSIGVRTAWRESVGKSDIYVFTPAVVGDAAFVAGGKGEVLRIEGGAVRWKIDAGTPLSGGVGSDGRRVVVGTPKGEVLAFDADGGKELWRARVSSEVLAAPAVSDTLVVVRSGDNRIFAFDAADGKRKWVYQRQTPPLSLRTFAAPLIDGGYVFAGFPGGKLMAITTNNGASAWEGTVALPKGTTELDRVADITSAPVIAGRMICAVAYQGRIACFDLGTGNLAWARDMSSAVGLAADDRHIYVSDDQGAVHALALTGGASIWKQDKLRQRQLSAPLALGNTIAVGDLQGMVHFLSREDGAFVGRATTDGTPVVTQPQRLGDRLLLQTRGGSVLALDVQ